ncbi:hypothetical protein ACFLV7_11540 [Chloroflexota bacterium]
MQDEQVLIAIPGASKRRDAEQCAGAMGFRLSERRWISWTQSCASVWSAQAMLALFQY